MNKISIEKLNALNRTFYATVADDFDTTRGAPWPGWARLLPYLPARQPLSVLDIGCGNGRFGAFLAQKLNTPIRYHGVDNNPALLDHARARLAQLAVEVDLQHRDVIEDDLPDGSFDLAVMFGVLHHVPGGALRREMVRAAAERVAPGGLLMFSCWRFYEYERFRSRIAPWPADIESEPGDFLLDWRLGANVLRYCHYVDDAEHQALIDASGLQPVATYRADSRSRDANQHTILLNH